MTNDATPEESTPTTKARRAPRRSTRAATSAAEGSPATAPEATDATADPKESPPKKSPSRSRVKKAAAPADDSVAAPEPSAEDQATQSPMVRVGGSPRLASTAMLFQAPEPTVRPRRRVEAPAGPPRPVETTSPEPAGRPDPEGEDALADSAEGGARRRRRGGRGRGKQEGENRPERAEASSDEGEKAQSEGKAAATSEGKDGRGRGKRAAEPAAADGAPADKDTQTPEPEGESSSSSRRRRRRRRSRGESDEAPSSDKQRDRSRTGPDEVTALRGSTRLEAKRQRRREGRDAGRRRATVTEAEFLARRESVERSMVVREAAGRVQIAVLEDGVLVEHYVSRAAQNSNAPMAGNVYLGRVQNVLPSMEAAFVDIGKGRNAVLYAGEVNWDAAGMEGQPRRIEQAMKSGDAVLVQVTKDPVGHKGARLTSQITLAGRYLVYVPGGGMTGISRKLPDNERARLKKILKEIVPDDAGVIVRTAAEGASDEELRRDVSRLQEQWAAIEKRAKTATPPALLQGEPDLAIRVVRDIFNDDVSSLVVQGGEAWEMISGYVAAMAPDLADRVRRWEDDGDVFAAHRIDEQLAKGMDRKVWLPSGGSLVIDRTEAMTVIDVNTGKFTGSGGTLEETVTRNNLEAAEELVRQLRLRDIGGIIVIDFIDMVLESNRDLVLRRLVECLGRDRTKHQVAEVTSLGLVQMTRKRVGQGLIEAFSETCQHCNGRGFIVHSEPVDPRPASESEALASDSEPKRPRRRKASSSSVVVPVLPEAREAVKATLATIAAAAAHAHEQEHEQHVEQDRRELADEPSLSPPAEGVSVADAQADPAPQSAPEHDVPDAAAAELADVVASVAVLEKDASDEGVETDASYVGVATDASYVGVATDTFDERG